MPWVAGAIEVRTGAPRVDIVRDGGRIEAEVLSKRMTNSSRGWSEEEVALQWGSYQVCTRQYRLRRLVVLPD
jgi:hypothetical protein